MKKPPTIGSRKDDHIALCSTDEVAFRGVTPLFEQVRFLHDALPDLDAAAIDTSTVVLGKRLRAPILIAAMTGGTDEAARINRGLAKVAEARGYGFGLGSQRAMLKRPEVAATYAVRDVAPTMLLLGNLGVIQAAQMQTSEVEALARAVGADAICIHLNPAMEIVQPEGDRDFRGGTETLARLARELPVPVVAKETGSGLSGSVAARLVAAGVRHVDVSGAGGTSWVGVETKRAAAAGDEIGRTLGEAFWDWGIPTAASVALVASAGLKTILATGGVASGVDVAKAIALGASAAGIARPVLQAFVRGGEEGAHALLDQIERELRAVMLLTGSADIAALGRAPKILGSELRAYVESSSRG